MSTFILRYLSILPFLLRGDITVMGIPKSLDIEDNDVNCYISNEMPIIISAVFNHVCFRKPQRMCLAWSSVVLYCCSSACQPADGVTM